MARIHALYSRVSTDNQRDKGLSIPRQKRWLEDAAKYHNFTNIRHFIDDGFSAKNTNRPAYQEIINLIKNNQIESVMVYRFDRIARNLSDLINLINLVKKHDVNLVSLMEKVDTKTAIGNAMFMVIGVFSQFEREMVSERVSDVMWDMAKNGKYCGGQIPYGYNLKNKNLIVNKQEAGVIKDIYNKIESGNSIRGITIWLNDAGHKPKRISDWSTSTVRRILVNPLYMGYYTYGKKLSGDSIYQPKNKWLFSKGNFAPIIKKPQFNRVQKIIAQHKPFKRSVKNSYLLSGLARCECGGSMTGHTMRRRDRKTYSYYVCHNHTSKGPKICMGNTISREILETYVSAKIKTNEGVNLEIFPDEKKRELVTQKVKGIIVKRNKNIVIRLDNSNSV